MYLLLLLLPFVALATNSDFDSLDFIAAAPYTYNHKVGGGAYNDRTIGLYADVVESLEGKQEACNDYISYFLAITMRQNTVDTENSASFQLSFLGDSTGKSGVALGLLKGVYLNGPSPVENGNGGGYVSGGGVGVYKTDGFWNDRGQLAKITFNTSYITSPLFNPGSSLIVNWGISGLSAGDKIPVRIDIQLLCQIGSTPTGNLQASLSQSTCTTNVNSQTAISGGSQTIPFKTVSSIDGLGTCIPKDAPGAITGVEFTATAYIHTPSMVNGGYSISQFYYSWSQGTIRLSGTSTSSLQTYDTKCTYLHQGQYLYSQGTCGCESVWIDAAQPQLFYSSNGLSYFSPPSTVTYNGIVCNKYLADNTVTVRPVSELYLRANDSVIVRAVLSDGTSMDFFNVVYGPISPQTFSPPMQCSCKRRLDISILLDKSVNIDSVSFTAQNQFAANLTATFQIGPNNAQFALWQFDSTPTMQLSINDGISSSNVLSKINSLTCKLTSKFCGSTTPDIAVAINASAINLKSSSRANMATPVIVVVTQAWPTILNSQINNVVTAARQSGISVFLVIYQAGVTIPDMQNAFGDLYYVIQRLNPVDLVFSTPDDVQGKICKQNTRPCGNLCCGVCDTACSACIPVDNCFNDFENCVNETIVSGSCCVVRSKTDSCTVSAGQCAISACNAGTGQCDITPTCVPQPGDNCYDYSCVKGACITSLKVPSTTCNTVTCVNQKLVSTPRDCGVSTACLNVSCVEGVGCLVTPIPDPNPDTLPNPCNPRVCDPVLGWKNEPVVCTTSDPCFPNICVNGACSISPILCGNKNNLCDLSQCIQGVCSNDTKICTPPDPCQLVDPIFSATNGCIPATGKCSFIPKICQSSTCMNQVCNISTGECEDIPTEGCSASCSCPNDKCTKTLCDSNNMCLNSTYTDCSVYIHDNCTVVNTCNGSTGCSFSIINCTSVAPIDKCHYIVSDPYSSGCCVNKVIDCDKGNPCKNYDCDPVKGCVESEKCLPSSDKCVNVGCDKSGCTSSPVVCNPPNGCYSGSCNSTTGNCVFESLCNDHNACTDDTCESGACIHRPIICDDNNVCTDNVCLDGSCSSTYISCDDGNDCTIDSCDSKKGCQHIPDDSFCTSLDPCVTRTCDVTRGCITKPYTCPSTGMKCIIASCIPYIGCSNSSMMCNITSSDSCTFVSCKEDDFYDKPCQEEALSCDGVIGSSTILAAATGASVAFIAGIAAAAIVGTGLLSGAAVAVARNVNADDSSQTSNNPLYVAAGNNGDNPLFVPKS